jgi:hypothetical protein
MTSIFALGDVARSDSHEPLICEQFNLLQMVIIFIAVVEGLFVHHLIKNKHETFAIQFDQTFRWMFVFLV